MATWIVGGIVAVVVGGIVALMIREKKSQGGGCGGNCASCRNCRH